MSKNDSGVGGKGSGFGVQGSGSQSEPERERRGLVAADSRLGRGLSEHEAQASDSAQPGGAGVSPADSVTDPRSDYPDDLFCPECGYNLRGISSPRCPECGLVLDFVESDRPVIPWELRREIGRVRAFRRTVWQVIRRPKVFCRAVYRPVDYYAAQKFRWLCVMLFFATLLGLTGIVQVMYPNLLPEAAEETGWWFIAWNWVCILLALLAFTGIPSYFFHPRQLPVPRQNRAVALSYYACTPLALGPLLLAITGIGLAIWKKGDMEYATWGIAGIVGFVLLGCCWAMWSAFAKHTLIGTSRRIWLTWLVPPLWLVACGLILVVLPGIAYFLALVYYSLQPVRLGG